MLEKEPEYIDWDLTGSDPRIKGLVEFLYEDLDLGRLKVTAKKELLTTILMNLLLSVSKKRGIQYPRNNAWYQSVPAKYKYYFVTHHFVTTVVDALIAKDYIVHRIGSWDMLAQLKESSVMKPSVKLLALFSVLSTEVIENRQPAQTVLLRGIERLKVLNPKTGRLNSKKVKTPLDYEDTPAIVKMRAVIKKWNDLRGRTIVTLSLPKALVVGEAEYMMRFTDIISETEEIVEYKVKPKYSHRVFNNNFATYGRFAGASETLFYRDYRPYFRINNEATVEADFEAFHTRMLYNIEGIDYQRDPYQIAADSYSEAQYKVRKYFKKIGLMSINAPTAESAKKAVSKKLVKENTVIPYGELTRMLDHWLLTHQPIAKYLCTNKGLELMYLDSQIAEKVIKHFTDLGIMVLCVHDSFIIQERYKEDLRSVMESAYQEVMGTTYNVPIDYK
ncbi:MAG: hypothetical protein NTY74_14195 [Ignavibacteriae bacterium]|nr:hypothetical protein [Ignavibacteriota bacterium]